MVLIQCLTEIRHAERAAVTLPEEEQHTNHQSHPRTQAEQYTQQARQSERSARYEHIVALSKQGMKPSAIAFHLGCLNVLLGIGFLIEASRMLIRDANGLASLIPTKPICSRVGTKAVTMAYTSKEN